MPSPDPRRAALGGLLAPRPGGHEPITVSSDPGLQFQAVDGVVDLVEMRALVWAGDAKGDVTMGAKYDVQEIPADMADVVAKYRDQLGILSARMRKRV